MKTLPSISLLQLQTQLASLWSGESATNCHSLNVLLSYCLRLYSAYSSSAAMSLRSEL